MHTSPCDALAAIAHVSSPVDSRTPTHAPQIAGKCYPLNPSSLETQKGAPTWDAH